MIAGALGVQRAYHMKLKLRKKRKNERKLLYPAVFVLLLVFGFSVYKVVSIRLEYKQANDAYEAITAKAIAPSDHSGEAENDLLTVNHASLSAMNADYIGWLDIPGAGISYPVVLAADISTPPSTRCRTTRGAFSRITAARATGRAAIPSSTAIE